MARIGQIKRAAGLGYAHFIKSYGTQGVLVYFFDHVPDPAVQPLIEKFARLLRALMPDVPRHSSTAVIRQGLDALRQGIAIWEKETKKLLYENKAYHALFGGGVPFLRTAAASVPRPLPTGRDATTTWCTPSSGRAAGGWWSPTRLT